jgi:hypothetical protein
MSQAVEYLIPRGKHLPVQEGDKLILEEQAKTQLP